LRRNGVEIRGRSEAILAVGARRRRWRYEPEQMKNDLPESSESV